MGRAASKAGRRGISHGWFVGSCRARGCSDLQNWGELGSPVKTGGRTGFDLVRVELGQEVTSYSQEVNCSSQGSILGDDLRGIRGGGRIQTTRLSLLEGTRLSSRGGTDELSSTAPYIPSGRA